ncbi:MAG: Glucans biosynthesis protein [Verrucomicrobiales bacterium]|nr:Glucans biosynthesis protein [Verrucomicrobiales bacterium]
MSGIPSPISIERAEIRFAFTSEVKKERFYAMDSVRAVAMLLGVVLHIVTSGFSLKLPTPPAAIQLMNWIHGFRMPLFFLISGFFCRMMYLRYGYAIYFQRRTGKLSAALLVALAGPVVFYGFKCLYAFCFHHYPDAGFSFLQNFDQFRIYFLGLGSLWFLWYLMIFASVGPLFAKLVSSSFNKAGNRFGQERFQNWMIKLGMVPLAVALISLPFRLDLVQNGSWALGFASGITSTFPDVIWQFQPDWPFYFVYFASGWWLERAKGSLNIVAKSWVIYLLLGVIFYFGGVFFEGQYFTDYIMLHKNWLGIVGCGLFSLGTSFTVFGLIAFFQSFMNRSSSMIRYFSDRAFWIYIAHFKIVSRVLVALDYWHLSYVLQTFLAFSITTLLSCAIYDLFVRPTFLSSIFGSTKPAVAVDFKELHNQLTSTQSEPITSL